MIYPQGPNQDRTAAAASSTAGSQTGAVGCYSTCGHHQPTCLALQLRGSCIAPLLPVLQDPAGDPATGHLAGEQLAHASMPGTLQRHMLARQRAIARGAHHSSLVD